MKRLTLILAVITTACCGTPALATTPPRYASPTGTSADDCATPATACDIVTAIDGTGGNQPVAGQEIIVEPGTYTLTATLQPTAGMLDVHGVEGQPRPVIQATNVMLLHPQQFNDTFSYLEFAPHGVPGDDAINMSGGLLDRVLITGDAGDNLCQCYDGTIRDSVLVQTGAAGGAWGLNTNGGTATETLRNDTFVATTATAWAMSLAQNGGPASPATTIDAKNVIAINTAGGNDVRSYGPKATITLANSDYANPVTSGGGAITDGGGNISSAPAFVDQAGEDYREQATSPTVDAGTDDTANDGTIDFAGGPRQTGARTDIGAFEYQPPVAIAVAAGQQQSTPVTTPFVQPLEAKVTDAQGAPVPDVVVTFTAPGSGASASFAGGGAPHVATGPDGLATAPALTANTNAGAYTVSAAAAGVGTAAAFSLRNTAGPPKTLKLSPGSSTVASGTAQTYTIDGVDMFGNDGGPVTTGVQLAITPDGSCSALSCTALKPGAHTVTATAGAATGSATLQVTQLAPQLGFGKRAVSISPRTRRGRLAAVCRAPAGAVCAVSGKLGARIGGRRVTLGTVSGNLAAGAKGRLQIRLSRHGIAAVAQRSRHARAALRVTDVTGTATVPLSLTLRLAKR